MKVLPRQKRRFFLPLLSLLQLKKKVTTDAFPLTFRNYGVRRDVVSGVPVEDRELQPATETTSVRRRRQLFRHHGDPRVIGGDGGNGARRAPLQLRLR